MKGMQKSNNLTSSIKQSFVTGRFITSKISIFVFGFLLTVCSLSVSQNLYAYFWPNFSIDVARYIGSFMFYGGIAVCVGVAVATRSRWGRPKQLAMACSLALCACMLVTPVASALTPLPSDRGPGNSSAFKFSVPFTEYQWIVAQFRDGTYYAVNGSDWNIMTIVEPWQPVAPWAALAENKTALVEQVLSVTDPGKVLLNELSFDYALTVPENVTVVESLNGLTRSFINEANSQGSPYTVSVDSGVNVGYYLVADSEGRICFSSTNTNTTITSALTSGAKVEVTKGSYPNTWVSLTNGSSLTIQKGATGITALPSYQLTATLIDYQNGVTKTYTNGHVARTYMNSQSQTIFNNEAQVLPTVIKQEIAGCYQPVDAVYNPDMDTIAIASRFNPTIGALTIINATTLQFISNISFTNADLQPYRIKYDGVNYWITTGSEWGSPTFGGPAGLICIDPYTLAWDSYLFPDANGTYANGLALEFADSPTTGKNYVFVGTGSVAKPNWAAKVHKFDPLTFTSGPLTTIDIRNVDLGNYAANIRELVNTNDGYIWALGDTYPTQIEIDSMNFKYLYAVAGYEYAYLSGAIGRIPVQFCACYGGDGYLYLGLVNGSIAKVNPTTGAVNFPLTTLSADSLVHHLQALPNGFIFAQLWGNPAIPAYYINTATLTIYDTPQTFTCAHSLTWDAKGYIYVIENANEVYNTQPASLLTRYPIQTPTGANGTLILP